MYDNTPTESCTLMITIIIIKQMFMCALLCVLASAGKHYKRTTLSCGDSKDWQIFHIPWKFSHTKGERICLANRAQQPAA